jgi:hypothetical protein
MIELKTDDEFEGLIPPSNEYEALEKSIVDNGYDKTCPIRIWKGHDVIVDGHNRYRVCKEHNIEFIIVEMEFSSREAVRDWMYREQLTRRNLDKLQRNYFMGMVYKAEKKPKGTNQYTMNEDGRKSATQSKKSTAEKVGKLFHVSHETVKEAEKFADAINNYAKNSEIKPYELLSTFSNEIKTTQSEIVDVSKKFSSEDQKAAYYLIAERKADSLTNAIKIVAKNRKRENGIVAPPLEENDPSKPTQPETNEHGAQYAYTQHVDMNMVKIKPEHIYNSDKSLKCDIDVDGKRFVCCISSLDNENVFSFKLPNIENLLIDFNSLFHSLTPIFSHLPIDKEYLDLPMILSHQDWNAFVQERFPDLIIEETKKIQLSKPDEFRKNHIKISDNVQVALKKAMDESQDLLEEILTSNSYDEKYEFTAVNSYKLDRNLYVTDDHYGRLDAIAKEHGAKDLNEVIARLWQGHKKQIAEGSKKAKAPRKKKKAIDISHQNSDDAPPNAL